MFQLSGVYCSRRSPWFGATLSLSYAASGIQETELLGLPDMNPTSCLEPLVVHAKSGSVFTLPSFVGASPRRSCQ